MISCTLNEKWNNTLYYFRILLSSNVNIHIHKAKDILFLQCNSLSFTVDRKLRNLAKHNFRSDKKTFFGASLLKTIFCNTILYEIVMVIK